MFVFIFKPLGMLSLNLFFVHSTWLHLALEPARPSLLFGWSVQSVLVLSTVGAVMFTLAIHYSFSICLRFL